MNEKLVIVIPIHTSNPTKYELISFQQCFKVLCSYAIKVIAPKGLDLVEYKNVSPQMEVLSIEKKWLSSIAQYNRLKRSRFFYNLFRQYEFLLTYELDAFIFRDDMEFWCKQGYDYIGAPWFEGWAEPKPGADFVSGGNSGFSLRRLEPVEKILKSWFYKNPVEYNNGLQQLIKAYTKAPYRWLMSQGAENYTIQNNCGFLEDVFWSRVVPAKYSNFKVAPSKDAVKFSFEVNPRRLYELNGDQLPTGCHAWWKYDLTFWKPFIEREGYSL